MNVLLRGITSVDLIRFQHLPIPNLQASAISSSIGKRIREGNRGDEPRDLLKRGSASEKLDGPNGVTAFEIGDEGV